MQIKKINIYNHNMPNSVIFTLPKDFIQTINHKSVVITEIKDEINIREAMLCDVRSLKVMPNNQVTYTTYRDKEKIIGEYQYEIEGDTLILYR